MGKPLVVVGDSSRVEHSALLEHVMATAESSPSDYTANCGFGANYGCGCAGINCICSGGVYYG